MRAHEDPANASEGRDHVRSRTRPEPAGTATARPGQLSPAHLLHLQRTAGNASVVQLLGDDAEERSPVKDVVGSGTGAPLDAATRTMMESRFGQDFGDVRVHTDAKATESARSVHANAYTVGRDVVFRSDQWSPGTASGQRMLAHELTHVVQQRSGPVDGTPAPGGIQLSDPSDRFEREADTVAHRVMSAEPVQRQEEEPEEEVQGSAVQRQEDQAPEEEDVAGA